MSWDLFMLLVLYGCQSVPLSLAGGALPFIFKGKLSYTAIGMLSFCQYPFSMKLILAPLIDTKYLEGKWFGRRKSWVVPCQFACGSLMIYGSYVVHSEIEVPDEVPSIVNSFCILFASVFLMATQDVAVDGWGLTLLRPDQISTCQNVGMGVGAFVSFPVLVALSSSTFCNSYVFRTPSDLALLSPSSFMHFCGSLNLVIGAVILVFKTEPSFESLSAREMTVWAVYNDVIKLVKLPVIQMFAVILVLCRIMIISVDTVTKLQIIDRGVAAETLAVAVILQFPLEMVWINLAGWLCATSYKDNPLRLFILAYSGLALPALIFPYAIWHMTTPLTVRMMVTVLLLLWWTSLCLKVMSVSLNSMFAKVSDPDIGGTYMTLLWTLSNLGWAWPKYFAYRYTDVIGYVAVSALCFIVGCGLLPVIRSYALALDTAPPGDWSLSLREVPDGHTPLLAVPVKRHKG